MVMELNQIKNISGGSGKETIDRKAVADLGYLALQQNLALRNNVRYQSLVRSSDKLADLLVVGHDVDSGKVATAPLADVNADMHVALVTYSGGKAIDAYLIPGLKFLKGGMFSCVGGNKKTGEATINIGNKTKLAVYSFGNVIKTLI